MFDRMKWKFILIICHYHYNCFVMYLRDVYNQIYFRMIETQKDPLRMVLLILTSILFVSKNHLEVTKTHPCNLPPFLTPLVYLETRLLTAGLYVKTWSLSLKPWWSPTWMVSKMCRTKPDHALFSTLSLILKDYSDHLH